MSTKICVYGICKNESKFLYRWFDSIKDADYIRLLDTGSTDSTLNILKQLKENYPDKFDYAEKEIKPWRFDVARNESMKLVPADADILVSADIDDVFIPNWREIIERDIEAGYNKIYGKYPYYDGDQIVGDIIQQDRVCLNDGKSHWENGIHERLVTENEHAITDDEFVIEHRQDLTKERRDIYLEAAKNSLEDGNDYAKLCYSYELANYGKLEESLESFKDLLSVLSNKSEYKTRKMLVFMGDICTQLGDLDQAVYYYKSAFKINNRNSPFEDYFLYEGFIENKLANIYFNQGDYCKAMQYSGLAYKLTGDKTLYQKAFDAFWADYDYYNKYNIENSFIDYIRSNYAKDAQILDVGAEEGRLADFLYDYKNIDAIEINHDKIDILKKKYKKVYEEDALKFRTNKEYDLVVLADLLEHLIVEDAQKLIEYFSSISKEVLVVVPYMYLQDITANPYDNHIQYDLTDDIVKERYPSLNLIHNNDLKGIYTTKKIATTKVCVYTICKNEEQFVKQWFGRVKNADLIVVLDTGSTDNTVQLFKEVSKECDNFVIETKKYEDFAFDIARNDCMSLAKNFIPDLTDNWVMLHIDMDEMLNYLTIDRIREQWDSRYDLLELTAFNVNNMISIKGHRLDDDINWHYAIHEKIAYSDFRETKNLLIKDAGYNHYQDTSKNRDYYGKLQKAHEKNPNCIHYLTYLVWEALLHNDKDNLRDYCHGAIYNILNNERDEHYKDWKHFIYVSNVYYDNFDKAREVIENTIQTLDKQEADFRAYYMFKANMYKKLNNIDGEYKELKKALLTPITNSWIEANYEESDADIYLRLELINYYNFDNFELAYLYARLCYQLDPNDQNRSNLKFCEERFKEILNEK